MQLVFGLTLGALIGWLAWRARALSLSGAIAAALMGGVIFGFGGVSWASLLLTFFISSSALSRLFSRRKSGLGEKFSKGSQRDGAQVLANGGLGMLLVLASGALDRDLVGSAWPSADVSLWVAYAGALAAVNADTWATELGVLNPTPPRMVTTWKRVERGTSGAVSRWGTLATLGGAALIGLVAVGATPWAVPAGNVSLWVVLLAASLGGLAGSFFDSFLGATVQAIYYCPVCQKETERHPQHTCDTETVQVRGWRWLNNDGVNFICSLVGALTAVTAFWVVQS